MLWKKLMFWKKQKVEKQPAPTKVEPAETKAKPTETKAKHTETKAEPPKE